jgi:putative transposase
MLIVNERHLTTVLDEYVSHYNEHRPHRGLQQRPPSPRPDAATTVTAIRQRPILGGLINEYSQAA